MKKLVLVFMAAIVIFSTVGNLSVNAAEIVVDNETSVESDAVLQVYAYSAGGANYLDMRSFDKEGTLMNYRLLEAGYVYTIKVQIGGHVELEALPAKDFFVYSASISSDEMMKDKAYTHFSVSVTEAHGYASFIFKQSPSRDVVFDIRSFKGAGTITFSTDGAEKSQDFSEGRFYGGFVPSYSDIQKLKTPPSTLRANLQQSIISPSFCSLIYYYESLNKVYITGKYTATIKVNGDAYLEVNGIGAIIPKNGTKTVELNSDLQAYEIRVRFLGDPPHSAL
jgi:hypothetical protein